MKRFIPILFLVASVLLVTAAARRSFFASRTIPSAVEVKDFQVFDDFSIPIVAGSVTNSTNTINGTLGVIPRIAVDTRSLIDIEAPIGIFTIGDSKTDSYYWPVLISAGTNRFFEYPERLAKVGWTLPNAAAALTNYLNSLPDTPAPANVLINLGANGTANTNEPYVKTNFFNMVTVMRAKWPDAKFGIVPVFRTDSSNNCIVWQTHINQLVSSNSSYMFEGPNEQHFITNAAYSSDGVHPTTDAGNLEWGARWRTNLIVNGATNALPLGMYLRYNTNTPISYAEQTFTHSTNTLNTVGSDGKSYRWRMLLTGGHPIGTSGSYRISDVAANDWTYTLNNYDGAYTNTVTIAPWFKGQVSHSFDTYFVQMRGYNFQFITSNSVPYLANVNFYSASGNNFKWTLKLRGVNIAVYQIGYADEPWLPTPLILDHFNNQLLSDGKAFNSLDYKDYLGAWWPNGTNVTWTPQDGTWICATNTLVASALTGTNAVVTVPGVQDVIVFTHNAGTNAGLLARYTDTNNFLYAKHTGAGGAFQLRCRVNGVDQLVRTAGTAWQAANRQIRLVCAGSNVVASFGAAQASLSSFTITNDVLMTGTNIGVFSEDNLNGIQRFGAFSLTGHAPSTPFGSQ